MYRLPARARVILRTFRGSGDEEDQERTTYGASLLEKKKTGQQILRPPATRSFQREPRPELDASKFSSQVLSLHLPFRATQKDT